MRQCHNCRQQINDDSALYCSKCGARLLSAQTATSFGSGTQQAPGQTPTAKPFGGRKMKKTLILAIGINLIIMGGFFFVSKGCSSVTGTFVAKGEPLGSFTFVPKQCRSGQRMNFFGSVILGEGQQDGAVVAIIDPVKGKIVKVEVPGSCQPPDYEKCKEVVIDPKYCSRYDVTVKKIPVMVNNIVMVEGRLNVDCAFPGGGSARGEIIFKRCN